VNECQPKEQTSSVVESQLDRMAGKMQRVRLAMGKLQQEVACPISRSQ